MSVRGVVRKAPTLLAHYLRLRATKILLSALVLWLLLYQVFRIKLWRDPHSAFFKDTHVYELDYSLQREREARHFITRYNAGLDPPVSVKSAPIPHICVAIVTVRRDTDYFEATVGSILEGLDNHERSNMYLSFLFANTEPRLHPSWGQRWVERLADSATTYNVSEKEFEHLQKIEKERNFYEKGVFDYVYALQTCKDLNASHTIIFEDDIILATGWFSKTLKALAEIARFEQHSAKPWLYLRLFYTETSLTWTSSDFVYRNMPFVFGFLMLSTVSCLIALRRSRYQRFHLDTASIAVISVVCVPAFTAFIYMVGKYNLMPLTGVVEMNKYGCCTQGLVFPRERVNGLMQFLRERGHGQTDSMIEEYADSHELTRYALAPPQLQHVGLKSSRDNTDVNTQSTWAFWFETNDATSLKKEHQMLLQDEDVKGMLWNVTDSGSST